MNLNMLRTIAVVEVVPALSRSLFLRVCLCVRRSISFFPDMPLSLRTSKTRHKFRDALEKNPKRPPRGHVTHYNIQKQVK